MNAAVMRRSAVAVIGGGTSIVAAGAAIVVAMPANASGPDAVFLDLAARRAQIIAEWKRTEEGSPRYEALWAEAEKVELEIRDRPAAGLLGIAVKLRYHLQHYAEGAGTRGWRFEDEELSWEDQFIANAYADAMRLAGDAP